MSFDPLSFDPVSFDAMSVNRKTAWISTDNQGNGQDRLKNKFANTIVSGTKFYRALLSVVNYCWHSNTPFLSLI